MTIVIPIMIPTSNLEPGHVDRQRDAPAGGEEGGVEDDLDEHRVHDARAGGDDHQEGDHRHATPGAP